MLTNTLQNKNQSRTKESGIYLELIADNVYFTRVEIANCFILFGLIVKTSENFYKMKQFKLCRKKKTSIKSVASAFLTKLVNLLN